MVGPHGHTPHTNSGHGRRAGGQRPARPQPLTNRRADPNRLRESNTHHLVTNHHTNTPIDGLPHTDNQVHQLTHTHELTHQFTHTHELTHQFTHTHELTHQFTHQFTHTHELTHQFTHTHELTHQFTHTPHNTGLCCQKQRAHPLTQLHHGPWGTIFEFASHVRGAVATIPLSGPSRMLGCVPGTLKSSVSVPTPSQFLGSRTSMKQWTVCADAALHH